jgi:hypothetical protein
VAQIVESLLWKCKALSSNPSPACPPKSLKNMVNGQIFLYYSFSDGVPVAHTCNSSYSGDRHQENQNSKSAEANDYQDPISTKPIIKKGWWSDSRCRPWVQTPVPRTTKRNFLLWVFLLFCFWYTEGLNSGPFAAGTYHLSPIPAIFALAIFQMWPC